MTKHAPVFSPLTFVPKLADAVAAEPDSGGICRDTILRIRIAKALEARPEVLDHTYIARRLLNAWRAESNRVLNRSAGFYIPKLHIKYAEGESLQMENLQVPHIDSWDALNGLLTERFNKTMATKSANLGRWRRDLLLHPELINLGGVQRAIYGYVETIRDAAPFAGAAEEGDDHEDDA
jgi:hypothetical protein